MGQDVFAAEDWKGAELYKGESYWETDDGKVLDEEETIIEYLKEKGLLREVIEMFGVRKEL